MRMVAVVLMRPCERGVQTIDDVAHAFREHCSRCEIDEAPKHMRRFLLTWSAHYNKLGSVDDAPRPGRPRKVPHAEPHAEADKVATGSSVDASTC